MIILICCCFTCSNELLKLWGWLWCHLSWVLIVLRYLTCLWVVKYCKWLRSNVLCGLWRMEYNLSYRINIVFGIFLLYSANSLPKSSNWSTWTISTINWFLRCHSCIKIGRFRSRRWKYSLVAVLLVNLSYLLFLTRGTLCVFATSKCHLRI